MSLRITFDVILNHLANMEPEDFTRLADQTPNAAGWTENFDLATHIEQLRRVRDAMTPEERDDPTIINSRRRTQIVAESGFPAERLDNLIQMFQSVKWFPETMLPTGVWQFLGLSRFRPPDRA
jgi:signal recognition particle GTPase